MRFRTALLLLAGAAAPAGLACQTDTGVPLERGRTYQLASRALGESRTIDVSLPEDYGGRPDRRYPLVIVLDGEFEHEIAAATARFYAAMSQLPPLIVVGIRNTDRTRDLTPAARAGFTVPPELTTAGGAERFFSFLSHELLPQLSRTYRVAPMRVLIGHSLGGLFSLFTLARQPDLFTGYVVMEPSTWWNNQYELEQASVVLAQPAARRVRLMMVNAPHLNVDTTYWGGARPMVRELTVTGETHASMALAGMMLGLKTMFSDFRPADWRPGTRPIAMLERYDSLSERIGYEVPIPEGTFARIIRMSIHSRHFGDAERAIARMERSLGQSAGSRELKEMLARERSAPPPKGFIPLEIPSKRPTPRDAAAFLGRWISADTANGHEIEIRASGDTIIVRDRIRFPRGEWDEGDHPVIQMTEDGVLEWGLPWFRGLAALVVLMGRIEPDGSMRVTREPRGWVPRDPGAGYTRVQRFRRVDR